MKRKVSFIYVAVFALAVVSCVDDYTDANPPLPLDAPYAYVSSSIPAAKDGIPLVGGEEVTLSINIVDAPGVLDNVVFTFSKGGEVVSHTFDQIKGKLVGSFDVTVKAPMNLDGTSTVTIEVSDSQEKPKVLTISRVLDVSYLYDGPDFTVEILDDDGYAFEGDILDVVLTINDVPSGAIASIAAAGSAGTVNFDETELAALIGQSSGTITGTLEVGPVGSTGEYDVAVLITDELQSRQVLERGSIVFICPAAMDISGTYKSYSSGDAGDDYDNLIATVTITQENEGQFAIDDMSFGVYPDLYGDAAPSGVLNVCGLDISGDPGNRDQYNDPFTITGVVVETATDLITLEWSNTFGDSGKVTLVKQ